MNKKSESEVIGILIVIVSVILGFGVKADNGMWFGIPADELGTYLFIWSAIVFVCTGLDYLRKD